MFLNLSIRWREAQYPLEWRLRRRVGGFRPPLLWWQIGWRRGKRGSGPLNAAAKLLVFPLPRGLFFLLGHNAPHCRQRFAQGKHRGGDAMRRPVGRPRAFWIISGQPGSEDRVAHSLRYLFPRECISRMSQASWPTTSSTSGASSPTNVGRCRRFRRTPETDSANRALIRKPSIVVAGVPDWYNRSTP
jgi:hypothetical protein